jgi:predicted nuclease of predicted toxin-antitoxin system
VKFLIDAQLPRRLAKWLRDRGHDVIHTEQLFRKNRTLDSTLLIESLKDERVVVTKDSDFQLSFELGNGPFRLLLVATGNIHNDELLALFLKHETTIMELLKQYSFLELNRTRIIVHR